MFGEKSIDVLFYAGVTSYTLGSIIPLIFNYGVREIGLYLISAITGANTAASYMMEVHDLTFAMGLENVRVTDKKTAQNDPAVQEAVKAVAEALGDTGRILVRESGTEPVVRVMVEAPDHNTCQKYVDEVVNVICEKGYKA